MRFTKVIWHNVIAMDQKHIETQVYTPFKYRGFGHPY